MPGQRLPAPYCYEALAGRWHSSPARCLPPPLQLQGANERAQLLAEQLEEEQRRHAQLAGQGQEAEAGGDWRQELAAALEDRAALQQALEQANRQLAQAHRDLEALRLQLQQQARAAGLEARHAGQGHANGLGNGAGLAASSTSSDGGRLADPASPASHSRYGQPEAARQQQQQQYQQQPGLHVDSLTGKLSSFQRAMDQARQAGVQASQQVRRLRQRPAARTPARACVVRRGRQLCRLPRSC